MSQQNIVRRPLLSIPLTRKTVTSVEVREIIFEPNQETGLHRHPCPVAGYIAEGEAILEVQGEPPLRLQAGSAFHEPEGRTILRFDNASSTAKLKFICFYLLEGNQELIELLSQDESAGSRPRD